MPIIIIDRKRKQRTIEFNEPDPLGIEHSKRSKLNELPISEKEENPVDKWLCQNPNPKSLIGKKAYLLKNLLNGWIVDVYPVRMLLIKGFKDKQNRPVDFNDIIAIGD